MGSSPLARGLHPTGTLVHLSFGIIPARAGFTACEAGAYEVGADHPRSRGVYQTRRQPYASAPGSSPLARGLRLGLCQRVSRQGIIPARAGFTCKARLRNSLNADHPRSRGVYRGRGLSEHSTPGSSPLARGLPLHERELAALLGIIPARAGFTLALRSSLLRCMDHPRSRGVYLRGPDVARTVAGSSPLARGLPAVAFGAEDSAGIIPARTGFTRCSRCFCRFQWDHPRSRGVYCLLSSTGAHCLGSSPLARGLHRVAAQPGRHKRIIPARAGFTRDRRVTVSASWDHPRSRGVYGLGVVAGVGQGGSSPLARGLRDSGDIDGFLSGIIPARAGFTWGGSVRPAAWRIIPARAGFTLYSNTGACGSGGSSPLARGLPVISAAIGVPFGIIPARAGFTQS